MASIREDLTNLGVAPSLAIEIAKQMQSGTYQVRPLMELGFNSALAEAFVKMGNANSMDKRVLAANGMDTVVSAFIARSFGSPPVVSQNPSITGDAEMGNTLVADGGTADGPGTITSTLVWYADDVAIPDQEPANELVLTSDHVDAMITVGYTYCNEWGCAAEALSDPVGPVVE